MELNETDLEIDLMFKSNFEEQASRKQARKKLNSRVEDVLEILETAYNEVVEKSGPIIENSRNFAQVKDAISNSTYRQKARIDAVLKEKQDLKTLKTTMEQKIINLKQEIDNICEENHQIAQQCNHPDLPDLLKLMSSKSKY